MRTASAIAVALVAVAASTASGGGRAVTELAQQRVELDAVPGPSRAVVSGPNLWVIDSEHLWRFSLVGKGQAYTIPDRRPVRRLIPYKASVLAHCYDGELFQVNAAGTITLVRHIDPDVDDLIAIDGGFVALHSDRLNFWPRVADVGAAELTFNSDDGDELAAMPTRGKLVGMGADRFALVALEPYTLWVMGLDRTLRRFELDASPWPTGCEYVDGRHDRVVSRCGGPRIGQVHHATGKLFVALETDYKYRYKDERRNPPNGFSFGAACAFVDEIDPLSGELLNRMAPGHVVGVHGGKLVTHGRDGPDGPAYIEMAAR